MERPKIGAEQPDDEAKREKLLRKLTGTVQHASIKNKETLFGRLTAGNKDLIEDLSSNKPIFYKNDPTIPTSIVLDQNIRALLPQEFYDNPTQWIESSQNIDRKYLKRKETFSSAEPKIELKLTLTPTELLPSGESIEELWLHPYDISRVKEVRLGEGAESIEVVIKRIKDGSQEIETSKKAYGSGIPTPKIFGVVNDRGNTYAFFEKLPAISADAAAENQGLKNGYAYYAHGIKRSIRTIGPDFATIIDSEVPFIVQERLKRMIEKSALKNDAQYLPCKKLGLALDYVLQPQESFHPSYFKGLLEAALGYFTFLPPPDDFKNDLEALQRDLSIPDLKTFVNNIPSSLQEKIKDGSLQRLREKIKKLVDEENEKREKVAGKAETLFYKGMLGRDINKELRGYKKILKKEGIQHDFDNRNILIRWDEKGNHPLIEAGLPNLWIIDWEEDIKSPSN